MLKGLPDFSQTLEGENFIAFAPYQDGRNITVIPKILEIAQTSTGQPMFNLESVRPINPFSPVKAHGFLYMGLEIGAISEEMITQIRAKWPNKAFIKPHFYQGFLRLMPTAESFFDAAVKEELAEVTKLDGVAVSSIRLVKQLSEQAIIDIKNTLQEEFILIDAFAVLELKGLTPRLPITIEFDPLALLNHLKRFADKNGIITISKLKNKIAEGLSTFPVNFIKKDLSITPEELAITFTDWISNKFGEFVPAPLDRLEPHLQLKESVDKGTFLWDFSEPLLVSRLFSFQFDAFDSARKLVSLEGIDSIFKETTIRPLNTGFFRLTITHLFRTLPENVRKIGVKIHVPKNPGFRYRAINKTVYLNSKEDITAIELKFSPKEEKIYTYQTFVILKSSTGTKEVKGAIFTSSESTIRLGFDDFPISFIPVDATPALLETASIEATWNWEENDRKHALDFELTSDQPHQVIAIPKIAFPSSNGHIKAIAKSLDKEIELPIATSNSLRLNRLSFPEYGTHTLNIRCAFGKNEQFYIVELLPEGKADLPENITTFSFTPTQTQRTWTWFATSIFQPGFRYRIPERNGQNNIPWSKLQSPLKQDLEIGSLTDENEETMALEKMIGDKEFEDLLYYQGEHQDNTWYFIPRQPQFNQDEQGSPNLSLIIFGDKGILQITSEWTANQDTLEFLRKKIAQANGMQPALIQLAFAPIQIEKADLVLMEEQEEVILATSKTSGFAPFSAIFNAELTKEQNKLIIAAFQEQPNNLLIRYYATRTIGSTVLVQIEGDITDATAHLDTAASLTDCKDWVLQSIQEESLSMRQVAAAAVEASLKQLAEQEALAAAADYVQRFVQEQQLPNEANLLIEITKGEEKQYDFFVTTDISTWFSGLESNDFIKFF